ncbi:hypothetical protein GH714_017671 [Hevea brasiliensis]|uniref:Uncharacterized protein n=1 Tax=Hevea brasiliensis TaxID=3981 RepID=A0A6A6M676_HEVBR|nr:hypothetical protein GH714_017671 [Hevea brasiliensis]
MSERDSQELQETNNVEYSSDDSPMADTANSPTLSFSDKETQGPTVDNNTGAKRKKAAKLASVSTAKRSRPEDPLTTEAPTAPNPMGLLPSSTHSTNEPARPTTSSERVIGGTMPVSLDS